MKPDISRVLRIVDLPDFIAEDDLLACMDRASDNITTIKLVRDPDDESLCQGYGFIHFQTETDASRALEKYQGKSIPGTGKRFVLSFARSIQGATVDLFQMYVGGLSMLMTSDELFNYFKKFTDEVCNAHVVTDELGKSKGYGFVQFRSDEGARKTMSKLSSMDTGFIIRETHTRSRAEIERQVDHIYNTVIFIGNLNLSVSDVELQDALSRFGHVQSVRVVTGKGFGFVEFGDHISALAALSELQNSELFHQRVHCSWGQMRGSPITPLLTTGQNIQPYESQSASLEFHASMIPRDIPYTDKPNPETLSIEERSELLEKSLRTFGSLPDEPTLKSIHDINSEFIIRKFRR